MKKTVTQPKLEGDLQELFAYCPDKKERWKADGVSETFMGCDDARNEFRIPAADTDKEIFFNNRELLARFTNMALPTQLALLSSIRAALEKESVECIDLKVQWSKSPGNIRVIKIRRINTQGCLEIFI